MIRTTLLALSLSLSLAACGDTTEIAEQAASIDLPALVNPNTASEADMLAAGVPADVAAAAIANRPFADGVAFAEFAQANGAADVLDIAFIPLPLNTTDEANFKLIPGVGDKMAHEFEEYRPYTDMAQFDREIAKYVDAEELARLRRYVTVD